MHSIIGYIKPKGETARLLAELNAIDAVSLNDLIEAAAKHQVKMVYDHIGTPGNVPIVKDREIIGRATIHLIGYTVVAEYDIDIDPDWLIADGEIYEYSDDTVYFKLQQVTVAKFLGALVKSNRAKKPAVLLYNFEFTSWLSNLAKCISNAALTKAREDIIRLSIETDEDIISLTPTDSRHLALVQSQGRNIAQIAEPYNGTVTISYNRDQIIHWSKHD